MTDENDVNGEIVLNRELKADGLKLSYILIKRRIEDGESGVRDSYTLICECEGERAVLPDLTSIMARAVEIFAVFEKNTVTPVGAFDVIEEMI